MRVILCTAPVELAETLARGLVESRVVACVNVVPRVRSIYRWEGEVQRDQEWLLIAKSRRDVLRDLVRRVEALHSYDVPEIIALPLVGGSDGYLHWLDREVHGSWHDVD